MTMVDDAPELTHYYEPNGATKFVMVVAKEGVHTVDGREFASQSIDWREPPLPLMLIRSNDPTGRGGHKGSSAVGTISKLWREDDADGNGTIYGEGYFSSDANGDEARQLIAEGTISGVSADIGGAVVEELATHEDGSQHRIFRRGTILAVTALPIPAFDDTKVSVVQDAPIVASASEAWAPKAEWFADQNLDKPTPITVTADGQIFGHAALWGTCHVGYRDRCVTPPRSKSNYSYFNVGTVLTADGQSINVGRVTAGTGHAAIEFGANPAKEHYDNTGWAAAYVHTGEDSHGIWFAGSLSPTATDEQIAVLRASAVSGDWRAINGALELVGILAVNTPGFPVPKARAGIVAGAQVSLIASGLCGCDNEELSDETPAEVEIVEIAPVNDSPSDSDLALRLRRLDLEMWEIRNLDFSKMGVKKKACDGGSCGCDSCSGH